MMYWSEENQKATDEMFERHAPQGYKILMQFFDGETCDQAMKTVWRELGVPWKDIAAVPGHVSNGELGEDPPTFVPEGWMVFSRIR